MEKRVPYKGLLSPPSFDTDRDYFLFCERVRSASNQLLLQFTPDECIYINPIIYGVCVTNIVNGRTIDNALMLKCFTDNPDNINLQVFNAVSSMEGLIIREDTVTLDNVNYYSRIESWPTSNLREVKTEKSRYLTALTGDDNVIKSSDNGVITLGLNNILGKIVMVRDEAKVQSWRNSLLSGYSLQHVERMFYTKPGDTKVWHIKTYGNVSVLFMDRYIPVAVIDYLYECQTQERFLVASSLLQGIYRSIHVPLAINLGSYQWLVEYGYALLQGYFSSQLLAQVNFALYVSALFYHFDRSGLTLPKDPKSYEMINYIGDLKLVDNPGWDDFYTLYRLSTTIEVCVLPIDSREKAYLDFSSLTFNSFAENNVQYQASILRNVEESLSYEATMDTFGAKVSRDAIVKPAPTVGFTEQRQITGRPSDIWCYYSETENNELCPESEYDQFDYSSTKQYDVYDFIHMYIEFGRNLATPLPVFAEIYTHPKTLYATLTGVTTNTKYKHDLFVSICRDSGWTSDTLTSVTYFGAEKASSSALTTQFQNSFEREIGVRPKFRFVGEQTLKGTFTDLFKLHSLQKHQLSGVMLTS
jgi:hypothetical protein